MKLAWIMRITGGALAVYFCWLVNAVMAGAATPQSPAGTGPSAPPPYSPYAPAGTYPSPNPPPTGPGPAHPGTVIVRPLPPPPPLNPVAPAPITMPATNMLPGYTNFLPGHTNFLPGNSNASTNLPPPGVTNWPRTNLPPPMIRQ